MRAKGITYDTGFINRGSTTRRHFDPSTVRHELKVIRDELHCTAVRPTGGDPDRLELAATIAVEEGLEVWFSPFTCDLTRDELLAFLADCADRAERLRVAGGEVVLVLGAELTLFTRGFLPGETLDDRLALLGDPAALRAALPAVPALVNEFLARAVEVVRRRFGGRISYASIPFEQVDWTPFDFVGVDLYRSAEVAHVFEDAVRRLVASGKPVAITEFGSATFRGAAARGARGFDIVRFDGAEPAGLHGQHERDEEEQAGYVRELLALFDEAGVDTTFVNTFASYFLPHRPTPSEDLDLGSYGVVKVRDDGTWEPKAAFAAVADHHGRMS
ncbi:hypothetical protein [Saccharothrix xinjiangensis]|uniref:Abortive infection protein n=1 Tax=Saccharothrix xinjiangensis TaxID=204798 RepID=A0ABV9XVU8_9PSEU